MSSASVLSTEKEFDWSNSPGEFLISEQQWDAISKLVDMTPRERQVSGLLLTGITRDKIALELGIAFRTVRFHMEILHEKLHVRTRVDFVLRLIQLRDFVTSNPSIVEKTKA